MEHLAIRCPHCKGDLKVSAKFAGRRGLCKLCQQPFTIPGAGQEPCASATPHGGIPSLGPWDAKFKAFLEKQGRVGAQDIQRAVVTIERAARTGGPAPNLAEVLVRLSVLNPKEAKQLVHALNRAEMEDSGVREAVKGNLKECPNCFELIRPTAKTCRFCGEFLGEYELKDLCPNCKAEQPPGGQFCASCAADMDTGLVGGARRMRCPRCGQMSSGLEEVCAVCGCPLKASGGMVKLQDAFGGFLKLVRELRSVLILAVLVAGGLYAYKNFGHFSQEVKAQLFGEDEAAVRKAADEFAEALKYGDRAGLKERLAGAGPDDADALVAAFTGAGKDDELESIATQSVKMDGDQARVYVDIAIRGKKKPKPNTREPEDNLERFGDALTELQAGGTKRTEARVWTWTKVGAAWKVVLP